MAAPNRVEELRKRYHENPRRFFAPLANEYRKTGHPDRAILLCEKHLGEQPDNLNGLVVYGQTLYETGRHADARQPFEMALGLDPENLIALRHLGDIAKEEGDNEAARKWYSRVLEFDRRNEEVTELLESVGGGQAKEPPSGPKAAPSIVNVASSVRVTTGDSGSSGDPSALGMIDLDAPAPPPAAITEAPSAPRPPTPTPAVKTVEVSAQPKPTKRASLMDIAFDFGELPSAGSAPPPPPPAAPLIGAEAAEYGFAESPSAAAASAAPSAPASPAADPTPRPPALEDMPTLAIEPTAPRAPTPAAPMESLIELPPEPVDLGGVGRIEGLEAAEFSSDAAPLAGLEPSEFQSEEVAPLSELEAGAFTGLGHDEPEPMAPPPPADLGGTIAFSASRLEELGPPPAPRPTDGLPLLEPFEDSEPEPMPLPVPEVVEEPAASPAPFVTETMAELYLKQGHRDQAMDVYRQLIAQAPRDESLREKLAKLEAQGRVSIEFETPAAGDAEQVPPAPANTMLNDVSFDGLSLATPSRGVTPPRGAAPVRPPTPPRSLAPVAPTPPKPVTPAKPAAPVGPTAREYLAAFARRGFTPLSSPVIPSTRAPEVAAPQAISPLPGGGLDFVFGASVTDEDERAAHRLAGVGATSGPSGGSRLDSLFGEGPSAPMPASLAQSRGVQRASDKLKFDQFFTPDGPGTAAVAEAPSAGAPSAAAPSAGAPIDEFASAEPPSVEAPSAEAPSAAAPDDDDLDQFHGWLKGLTT